MAGSSGIIPPPHSLPPASDKTRRRVMWIAAFNGGSVALFGALCLIASLTWFSMWGILVGAAATASGCMELVGRGRVKQRRPEAGRWLAGSQLLLLGAILLYAGYQLLCFDPESLLKGLTPEYRDELTSILGGQKPEVVIGQAVHAIYAVVMFGTLLYQGGLCVYYTLAARKLLLEQPPPGGNVN